MTLSKKIFSAAGVFLLSMAFVAFAQKDGQTVTFYVTVVDEKGAPVEGLTAENFKLTDGKAEAKIVSFNEKPEPMSIGFLIDVSRSMQKSRSNPAGNFPLISGGLQDLIDNSHQENEYFAATFGDEVNILQELSKDSGGVKKVLGDLANVTPQGQTSLYDGIGLGLKKLSVGRYAKKALIVITDGQDSFSRLPYSELKKAAKRSNTLIYTISVTPPSSDEFSVSVVAGETFMTDLTSVTGGRTFAIPRKEKISSDVFLQLAKELQKQYAITFEPGVAKKKDEWREIDIDLSKKSSKLLGKPVVRSRQGYFMLLPSDLKAQN